MKKNYKFLDIEKGFWIQIRKISYTTIIMLEKTMYLDIALLLVKYRFHVHWSGGKHNAKIQTVN